MSPYFLFVIQSALLGLQVGLTVWKPEPVSVGIAVFIGCLTLYSLGTNIRRAA